MWPQSAGQAWRRSARSAWRSAAAVWSSHLDPTLWWRPGEFQCDLLWPEFLRWVTRRLKRFLRWFGSWFSVAQRIHVLLMAPSGNAGEPHWAGRLHPGLPGVDQQKLDSNNKVALVEMWNIVECWGLGSWSLIQFRNIPEMNAYRSIGRGHLANESKPGFCMHRVQFVMKCGSHGPTQQIDRNLTVQVEAKQSFFWGGTLQNNPNGRSEFPTVGLLLSCFRRWYAEIWNLTGRFAPGDSDYVARRTSANANFLRALRRRPTPITSGQIFFPFKHIPSNSICQPLITMRHTSCLRMCESIMLYLHVFLTHSVDVDYKYNGAQTEMSTPETS